MCCCLDSAKSYGLLTILTTLTFSSVWTLLEVVTFADVLLFEFCRKSRLTNNTDNTDIFFCLDTAGGSDFCRCAAVWTLLEVTAY